MTLHEIKGYAPKEKNKIKLKRHTKSSDTDKKKKKILNQPDTCLKK